MNLERVVHPCEEGGSYGEQIAVLMEAQAKVRAEAARSAQVGASANRYSDEWRHYQTRDEAFQKAIDWLRGEWVEKPKWTETPPADNSTQSAFMYFDYKDQPLLVRTPLGEMAVAFWREPAIWRDANDEAIATPTHFTRPLSLPPEPPRDYTATPAADGSQ